MWDGLFMLLLLGAVMAAASFLAGSLPLSFSLNARHMRLITACGTGVLVGTALIVIIPEGVETLYNASAVATSHPVRDLNLNARGAPLVDTGRVLEGQELAQTPHVLVAETRSPQEESPGLTGPEDGRPELGQTSPAESLTGSGSKSEVEEPGHDDHDFEPHAWVGVSLICGFILMYLIDRIPQVASGPAQRRTSYISLDRLGLHRSTSRPEVPEDEDGEQPHAHAGSRPSSITTGLVIHAAADGIALGASTTSSSNNLGFVVFLALMIHKAPAAFGLTSVLLKQGVSKRRARTHLVIFSLAAPIGALATWAAAHIVGGGSFGGAASTDFATGVLLLFSGGTFLYVAMHTMQDTGHDHARANGHAQNGYADPYAQTAPKEEGPTLRDTFATVGGMLLPLLTQVGHAH